MDNESPDLLDFDPIEDLMQADAELTVSMESLQRVMDSFTALESFSEAGSELSVPSFEALARPLLQAVYSGTDVEVALLQVSAESFKGMASVAVKAILDALRSFFTALVNFLSNMDLAASWLMRKVVLLERQVASSRGKSATEPTVTLGRQHRYLRVGRVFAEDSLRLETELKNFKNVIGVIGTDYLNEIMKAANNLPRAVGDKSGDALNEALVSLVKSIPFDSMASRLSMGPAPYDRFSRNNVQATPPLIGGKSMFYLKSDLDGKGVRGFRFHGFTYEKTGREVVRVEATHDFNTLSPAQIGNIPTIVRDILMMISRSSNASTRSQLNRSKATLENFARVQTASGGDIDNIRKTVSILTYWMSSPSRALFIDAMSVCRAVVSYCNASIKTYR